MTQSSQFPASEKGKNQARPQGEAAFIQCFACKYSSHLHPAQAPPRACSKAAGCHGNGIANAARLQGRWALDTWETQNTPLCFAPPSACWLILLLWETRNVYLCYSVHQDSLTSTQASRFQFQLFLLSIPNPSPSEGHCDWKSVDEVPALGALGQGSRDTQQKPGCKRPTPGEMEQEEEPCIPHGGFFTFVLDPVPKYWKAI